MTKTIGFVFLILVISIMFVTPLKDYCNNFLYKNKDELNEKQIIGTSSRYNPRVAETQQILKTLNLYQSEADGIMGDKTRKAIKAFQKLKNLNPTGRIDQRTQLALNREKENNSQVKKNDAKKTIIKPLVVSKAKRETRNEEKIGVQDEIMSYRLHSKNRTKQIQTALNRAGFYEGEIDGKIGSKTKEAIIKFQKAHRLKADGIVGKKTLIELQKYLSQ